MAVMLRVLSVLGVFVALVLIAVSMAANYLFYSGLGHGAYESIVFGAASIGFDFLKSVLPLFIGAAASNRKIVYVMLFTPVFLALFCASLTAEIGFLSSNRGAVVAVKLGLSDDLATLKKQVAELDTKVARVGAHEPAAAIAEALKGMEADKAFASSHGCVDATLPSSREFCQRYFAKKGELEIAKQATSDETRRDELRKKVAALEGQGAGAPADAQAELLAKLLPGASPEGVQLGWSIGIGLLLELMAAFGLYLSLGFFSHPTNDRKEVKQTPQAAVKEAAPAKSAPPVKTPQTTNLPAVARPAEGTAVARRETSVPSSIEGEVFAPRRGGGRRQSARTPAPVRMRAEEPRQAIGAPRLQRVRFSEDGTWLLDD